MMPRKSARYAVLHQALMLVPRPLIIGMVLAVVTTVCGIALLGLSGWFITAAAIAGLNVNLAMTFDVFAPSAGIRLLALGRTVSRYGERLLAHDAALSVLGPLRANLFIAWSALRGSNDLSRHPSRTLFRLTSDLEALEPFYLRVVVPVVAAIGAATLVAIIASTLALWLGLTLGLWLLLVGLLIAAGFARGSSRTAALRMLYGERIRARTIDVISGQTDWLMTGTLMDKRRALMRLDQRQAGLDSQLNKLDVVMGAGYGVATGVTLALVLLAAGWLAERHQITTAPAGLILLVALGAMEPFAALRRGALDSGRMSLAARRLAMPSRVVEDAIGHAGAPSLASTGIVLQMCQVSAVYPGRSELALQDVNLQLNAGEKLAVVGPSGAGKSSLMALACGELQSSKGTVITQAFSWLSQRADVFQDSVRNNLLIACPTAGDDQLWSSLEAAGLAQDVALMSSGTGSGLDVQLGEGGLGLSVGQARRLALARVLLRPHPLWLLDEPTEGLDQVTATVVLRNLQAQEPTRSWLLITHLRREAELADRILVLEAGRIVAEHQRGSVGYEQVLSRLRVG